MNKTVSFLLLSAVFGLAAMYLARNWLDQNQPESTDNESSVVVTIVPIATGTVINSGHIRLQLVPKALIPTGALSKPEDVLGKIAKSSFYQGDIVRAERLAEKGEGSALASLISPGKRAVSIRVNDVVGVAGFLLPGNRVDILNTYQSKGKTTTEVVLADVKILAIDQSAASSENKPQLVRAVTIEVNLTQAEVLMSARNRGSIQLALRNPVDNVEVVLARNEIVQIKPVKKARSLARRHKVELIRGVSQELVQVEI